MQKVKYDKNNDELVLVGDLVGKGPNSYEVLQFVKSNQIKCVLGITIPCGHSPARQP